MVSEVPLMLGIVTLVTRVGFLFAGCVSFSSSGNVSANKVSVVVVFVKNTFKVFVFIT